MKTKEEIYRQLREIAVEISDLHNEKILPGKEGEHESRLNNLGDLYNRTLDNLISKIRKDDIDGLVEWAEDKSTIFKDASNGTTAGSIFAQGAVSVLSDIIEHLQEIKEKV